MPTTYAGHAFWNEVDDEDRNRQQIQFLKNLAVLGGLLSVALVAALPARQGRVQGHCGRCDANVHTSKA